MSEAERHTAEDRRLRAWWLIGAAAAVVAAVVLAVRRGGEEAAVQVPHHVSQGRQARSDAVRAAHAAVRDDSKAAEAGLSRAAKRAPGDVLEHVNKRYRPPSEALQRAHTAAPDDPKLRDQCKRWVACVLQPGLLPPNGAAWPYLRMSGDEVESLARNYFYVKYRRDDTDIWIKAYHFWMYAVFTPAEPLGSKAVDEALAEAQRRSESHEPPRRDAASFPDELKQVLGELWATYLRVPLPPFDEGPREHRPRMWASPSCVHIGAARRDVPSVGPGCSAELWTDGHLVGINFWKPVEEYEAAWTAVWGGTPSPPDVAPLNPSEVALEDLHRYMRDVDGEPHRTNSPGPAGEGSVQVTYRKPWRFTSAYADTALYMPQSRPYWVKAPNGKVAEETWRLVEFHALTMQTLNYAIATTLGPNLATDLRQGRSRRGAWAGLQALRTDYTSVVERYRQLKSAPELRKARQAVEAALAAGEATWRLVEEHWKGALEVEGGPPVGDSAAFKQRLQADGLEPSQICARLRKQQEQIDELFGARAGAEAISVGG